MTSGGVPRLAVPAAGPARAGAARHARRPCSTSPSPSTTPATTTAAGATRAWSSTSTATSSARTAAWPSPPPAPSSSTDDDLLFVWRHLPLTDVHPHAQLAAEASEAAGKQGAFWPLHDLLLTHQDHLTRADLLAYAGDLGLDVDRFADDLDHHVHADRIATDIDSADRSGVSGTPTFFVNGRRHYGAYDAASLQQAVAAARERTRPSAR